MIRRLGCMTSNLLCLKFEISFRRGDVQTPCGADTEGPAVRPVLRRLLLPVRGHVVRAADLLPGAATAHLGHLLRLCRDVRSQARSGGRLRGQGVHRQKALIGGK